MFDFLVTILRLEWWVYIIAAFTFFTLALVLNYLVKKINEARLEERLIAIQNRASNNQAIQVQRRVESRLLSKTPLDIVLEQSNPPTVQGVLNKDDNNDRNKTQIDIKNFPVSKCLTTPAVADTPPKEVAEKASDHDIVPPSFLGKIYEELCMVERSKSMSNAEKSDVIEEIAVSDVKTQESKSAPSVKKVLDTQNKEDLKKRPL